MNVGICLRPAAVHLMNQDDSIWLNVLRWWICQYNGCQNTWCPSQTWWLMFVEFLLVCHLAVSSGPVMKTRWLVYKILLTSSSLDAVASFLTLVFVRILCFQ